MGDPGSEVSSRAFSGEPRRVLCFVGSEAWCSAAAMGRSRQRVGAIPSACWAEPSFPGWCRSERGTSNNNGRPAAPGPLHRLRSPLLSLLCQRERHFETGLLFSSKPASLFLEQIGEFGGASNSFSPSGPYSSTYAEA